MGNDFLALGAACSLPFKRNATPSSHQGERRCVGAHTTKFIGTSPTEMTWSLLGKWRLSASWLATVWHRNGCDGPENTCIRGLMLPQIFLLFAGRKIHGASRSTKRSLPFLRAADHHPSRDALPEPDAAKAASLA